MIDPTQNRVRTGRSRCITEGDLLVLADTNKIGRKMNTKNKSYSLVAAFLALGLAVSGGAAANAASSSSPDGPVTLRDAPWYADCKAGVSYGGAAISENPGGGTHITINVTQNSQNCVLAVAAHHDYSIGGTAYSDTVFGDEKRGTGTFSLDVIGGGTVRDIVLTYVGP